ncbi:MAG: hypothetical protein ACE5LU_07275 [Anaerolineae bacterium]
MVTQDGLKQQVVAVLDTLPEDALEELAGFLDYLQYKLAQRPAQQTPYTPVALGGLWEGVTITDEDITEVRRDMWASFGEREV